MGGPTGGAVRPGTAAGETAEAVVGNGEAVVKGAGRVGGGKYCPGRDRGGTKGLVMGGSELTEAFGTEMELVPGSDTGLVKPGGTGGGALTVEASSRGGVGLDGGVVSIPLSSIIFFVPASCSSSALLLLHE